SINEDALAAVADLANSSLAEHVPVEIDVPSGPPIAFTEQLATNAAKLIAHAKVNYEEGTIEGRLDALSIHSQPVVSVWETMTDIRVNCVVNKEQLADAMTNLGRRVSVSGRIRCRNGKPTDIHVDPNGIRVFREKADLPDPSNMAPIDITSGVPSEDYI